MNEQTNGRKKEITNGQTDVRTTERTDGRVMSTSQLIQMI